MLTYSWWSIPLREVDIYVLLHLSLCEKWRISVLNVIHNSPSHSSNQLLHILFSLFIPFLNRYSQKVIRLFGNLNRIFHIKDNVLNGVPFPSRNLLDIGFTYEYGLAEILDDSIEFARKIGPLPWTCKCQGCLVGWWWDK